MFPNLKARSAIVTGLAAIRTLAAQAYEGWFHVRSFLTQLTPFLDHVVWIAAATPTLIRVLTFESHGFKVRAPTVSNFQRDKVIRRMGTAGFVQICTSLWCITRYDDERLPAIMPDLGAPSQPQKSCNLHV